MGVRFGVRYSGLPSRRVPESQFLDDYHSERHDLRLSRFTCCFHQDSAHVAKDVEPGFDCGIGTQIFSTIEHKNGKEIELFSSLQPWGKYLFWTSSLATQRSNSAFASKLSRHVKMPLAALHNRCNDLEKIKSLAPQARSAVAMIRTAKDLLQVKIRSYANNMSERLALDFQPEIGEPCTLKEILNQAVKFIENQRGHKGIKVTLDIDPSISDINFAVNRAMLITIAYELISNAFEATKSGSVVVEVFKEVATKEQKISSFRRGRDFICIQVTGPGLPAKSLDEIKLRPTSVFEFECVAHIAKALGGRLFLKSNPKEGNTIGVNVWLLPCAKGTSLEAASLRGKSILIVEDSGPIRRTMKNTFLRIGCNVETAEDGKRGLAILRAHLEKPFDMVFTDIEMPVMNGFQLMTNSRVLGYSGPIVAMSASSFSKEKILSAGGNEFYEKPLTRKAMINVALILEL